MPTVFLSPSTQEFNPYITGGNEEQYMNAIVDDMEVYLKASGVTCLRNDPAGTFTQSIADSNRQKPDLHFALHSNAAPTSLAGKLTGPQIFYYPTSENGKRIATIVANNLKVIYPTPSKVQLIPGAQFSELTRVKAPSVYVELAYHDNLSDANWIISNIPLIARTLALSITEYFGIPLVTSPSEGERFPRIGLVQVQEGSRLNVRAQPTTEAPIIAKAANGAALKLLGETENDWYEIAVNDTRTGFVDGRYVRTA